MSYYLSIDNIKSTYFFEYQNTLQIIRDVDFAKIVKPNKLYKIDFYKNKTKLDTFNVLFDDNDFKLKYKEKKTYNFNGSKYKLKLYLINKDKAYVISHPNIILD